LAIDVYREWLKIESPERPPTHYALLGLQQFEDDRNAIQTNYRQRSTLVRRFASGKFSKESQDLLDELARAMLILTDPTRKGDYDRKLGRKSKRPPLEKRPLGQILLDDRVISANQLKDAQALADELGIDLGQALVQKQYATWDQATRALAQQHNLPYLDLADPKVVPELIAKIPADIAVRENLFPLLVDEQTLLVAVTHALNLETLELLRFRVGMPVRAVLSEPPAIRKLVQKHYAESASSKSKADESESDEDEAPAMGSSFAGWLWRNAKWMGIVLAGLGGVAGYFAFGVIGAVAGAGIGAVVLVALLFTSK
jgi:hypothetical protein